MNQEVFDRAITWIENNPDLHNQQVWARKTDCGTAYCLAGVVAMQAGWTPAFDGMFVTSLVTKDQILRSASQVARTRLNIDVDEGEALFHPSNTLEDLKIIGKQIAYGKEH